MTASSTVLASLVPSRIHYRKGDEGSVTHDAILCSEGALDGFMESGKIAHRSSVLPEGCALGF